MRKYKVLKAPASAAALEKLLNDEAAQGWELVTKDGAQLVFISDTFDISDKIESMYLIKNNELSTGKAAALVGCSVQTIKNHINSGSLTASKRGRYWVIKADDLQAWRQAQNL